MNKAGQISNLTLLLIYLTGWEEGQSGVKQHRAWKGYDFNILNTLEENGFIAQSKTAKSVYLTEQGLKAAKELEEKLSMI